MEQNNLKIEREPLANDAEDLQLLLEMMGEASKLRDEAERVLFNYANPERSTSNRQNNNVNEKTEISDKYYWLPTDTKRVCKRFGYTLAGDLNSGTITYKGAYKTFKEPSVNAHRYRYQPTGNGQYDWHDMAAYITMVETDSGAIPPNVYMYCGEIEHEYEYTVTRTYRKGTGVTTQVNGLYYPFWDILKSIKTAFYEAIVQKISKDEDDGKITHQEKQDLTAAITFDYMNQGIDGDNFDTKDPVWIFEHFISGISELGTFVVRLTPGKLGLTQFLQARDRIQRYQAGNLPAEIVCRLATPMYSDNPLYNFPFIFGSAPTKADELQYQKQGLFLDLSMFLPTLDSTGNRLPQSINFTVVGTGTGFDYDTASEYFIYQLHLIIDGNAYSDNVDVFVWLLQSDIENFPPTRIMDRARMWDEDEGKYEPLPLPIREHWRWFRFYKEPMERGNYISLYYSDEKPGQIIENIIRYIYIPNDHIARNEYHDLYCTPWRLFLERNPDYDEDQSDYDYPLNVELRKNYFHANFDLDYLAEALEGWYREDHFYEGSLPDPNPAEIAKIKELIPQIWSITAMLIEHENEQR